MPDWKRPDWKQYVRERLATQGARTLPGEVVAELAAHLEEVYDEASARGLSCEEALAHSPQEVDDWRVLSAEIAHARSREGIMNYRTKSLWLPALTNLLSASLLLAATQFAGYRPRVVWIGSMAMSFYWPWLAGLPVFGALAACLSRRSQGKVRARLAAGLSPALIMLIVMALVLPFGLAIDGFHFIRLVSIGLDFANWVALPAFALLLGALPFLRGSDLRTA